MTEKELNEEKKKFLRGYKSACSRAKSLELQIEELRSSKEQAKIQQMSGMPNGNKHTDLSDYIVQLEYLEEKATMRYTECIKRKNDIENRILDIPSDLESNILHERYVNLKSWEQIAKEQGYSVRQILRYHGEALHVFKNQDVTSCH